MAARRVTGTGSTHAGQCTVGGPQLGGASLAASRTSLSLDPAPPPATLIGRPIRVTRPDSLQPLSLRGRRLVSRCARLEQRDREVQHDPADRRSFQSPGAGGPVFRWFDTTGAQLATPVATPDRVALVRIDLRGQTTRRGPRARLGVEAAARGPIPSRSAVACGIGHEPPRRADVGSRSSGRSRCSCCSGIVVAALVASSVTAQRGHAPRRGRGAAALASAEYAASSILAGASTYQLARAAPRRDAAVRRTRWRKRRRSASTLRVTRLPRGVLWLVADAVCAGSTPASVASTWSRGSPSSAPLPPAAIEISRRRVARRRRDDQHGHDAGRRVRRRLRRPDVVAAGSASVGVPAGLPAWKREASATDADSYLPNSAAAVDTRLAARRRAT